MKRSKVSLVALLVAVIVSIAAWQSAAQSQRSLNDKALAQWEYPGAKQRQWNGSGGGGSMREFLYQATYTTSDTFDAVWKFYWDKVVPESQESLPFDTPRSHLGTFARPTRRFQWGFMQSPHPNGNVGSLLLKENKQTITIQIWHDATEKRTHIVLFKDAP